MLLSELIQKLQEIKDQQGDCLAFVDREEFDDFKNIVDVVGKDYFQNCAGNRAFIIIEEED